MRLGFLLLVLSGFSLKAQPYPPNILPATVGQGVVYLNTAGTLLGGTNLGGGGTNLWFTNSIDGSIGNVNGAGVLVNTSAVIFPFPGYSIAANGGVTYESVKFGDSSNSSLFYTENYANVTNTDGSIDTVFRRGVNQAVGSGATITRLPAIVEQIENHFVQNGTPVSEWHFMFYPTNGAENRFWTSQFNETNGAMTTSYQFDKIGWGPSFNTNNQEQAMQWTFGFSGVHPNVTMFFVHNSSLEWDYTADAPSPLLLKAQDSTSSLRQLINWDAVNKRFNLINNGDIQSIQIGAELWFPYNTGIGLQGTPGYQPKWIVISGGGLSVGGLNDPGAGNLQATNKLVTSHIIFTNGFYSATNTWSGATNNIDMSVYRQFYGSFTACRFNGIIGTSNMMGSEVQVSIVNLSATNFQVTYNSPGFVDRDHVTSQTVTNGTRGIFWVQYDPSGSGATNIVFNDF